MTRLTSEQAYRAMQLFLERHWARTPERTVADLLSELQLLEDGGSADPAALAEWRDCLERVLRDDDAGAPRPQARRRA